MSILMKLEMLAIAIYDYGRENNYKVPKLKINPQDWSDFIEAILESKIDTYDFRYEDCPFAVSIHMYVSGFVLRIVNCDCAEILDIQTEITKKRPRWVPKIYIKESE